MKTAQALQVISRRGSSDPRKPLLKNRTGRLASVRSKKAKDPGDGETLCGPHSCHVPSLDRRKSLPSATQRSLDDLLGGPAGVVRRGHVLAGKAQQTFQVAIVDA